MPTIIVDGQKKRTYTPEQKARRAITMKEYANRNSEKIRSYISAYYLNHKDKWSYPKEYVREKNKNWILKNPNYHKNWRIDNRGSIAETRKKWRESNRDYLRFKESKRRALIRGANSTLTKEEWSEIVLKHCGKCVHCNTTSNICMDHIIPLSRGGDHCKENIQPLCKPCNSRKNNKLESEIKYLG